jgi:putative chitinase
MDFTALVENLNYSANGLLATFRKYFTPDLANAYARKPQAIASRVYANRMGNGDEASGEGWKYRGRGILQVTGKNNYYQCSQFIFSDDRLIDSPELLQTPEYALRSACWYWVNNNLNALADTRDVEALTRRINGGTNGLQDRKDRYYSAMSYFGA